MTAQSPRNDLAPTLGRLRSLARAFREDRVPNRLLLVLRAVAGDIDWPTDLDHDGLTGLQRCIDTLTRRVLLIGDSGLGAHDRRFASRVSQWAVQASRDARTALWFAGVPITPGSGEMLHQSVTAALIWRKAQASTMPGLAGATFDAQVEQSVNGAARWNGLARSGINGWAPLVDLLALLDPAAGALPPGSSLIAQPDGQSDDDPRYEIERRRPVRGPDELIRIDHLTIRADETSGVRARLVRTTGVGEVTGRIAFGLLELCLLMTSQHSVVVGLGQQGYGHTVPPGKSPAVD